MAAESLSCSRARMRARMRADLRVGAAVGLEDVFGFGSLFPGLVRRDDLVGAVDEALSERRARRADRLIAEAGIVDWHFVFTRPMANREVDVFLMGSTR